MYPISPMLGRSFGSLGVPLKVAVLCATDPARHLMLRSILVPAGQSWAVLAYHPASVLHNFKNNLLSSSQPLRPSVDVRPTKSAVAAVPLEHGYNGAAAEPQDSSTHGNLLFHKADA